MCFFLARIVLFGKRLYFLRRFLVLGLVIVMFKRGLLILRRIFFGIESIILEYFLLDYNIKDKLYKRVISVYNLV